MKVGELKKIIANLPANAEVVIKMNGTRISASSAKTEVKPQSDGSKFKMLVITGE
jgi:hypothetical protein